MKTTKKRKEKERVGKGEKRKKIGIQQGKQRQEKKGK
jgi:hypothetical protein